MNRIVAKLRARGAVIALTVSIALGSIGPIGPMRAASADDKADISNAIQKMENAIGAQKDSLLQPVCVEDPTSHTPPSGNVCKSLFESACKADKNVDATGTVFAEHTPLKTVLPKFVETATPDVVAAFEAELKARPKFESQFSSTFSGMPRTEALKCLTELTLSRALEFKDPVECTRNVSVTNLILLQSYEEFKTVRNKITARVRESASQSKVVKDFTNTTFPRVKELLINRVTEIAQNTQNPAFNALISRIADMQPEPRVCDQLYEADAHYWPGSNRVQICFRTFALDQSVAGIVATLAHEMAHAIDPCNWARITPPMLGPNLPAGGTLPKSPVRNYDVTLAKYPFKNSIACLEKNARLNIDHYRGDPCENRQACEGFADMVSADILPQYLGLYASKLDKPDAFRTAYQGTGLEFITTWNMKPGDACKKRAGWAPFHDHPSWQYRLDRIYLQSPEMRKQMDCDPVKTTLYCGMDASASTPPRSKRASH